MTSDGTYNDTYDDGGNRISRTKISDSTKLEYTWDHRNRLTDVVFKNAGGTVTKKIQYQYDVFDRRIGRKLDADGNGTYESATYWVYDDADKRDPNTGTRLDDIVLEFNDADGDGSGAAALSTRYLHGPAIDQILASETVSGNVVTWALADHQGTVRDMVRYASGTTTIVNHRKFDAFGNLTAESDATVKFLFSYTGREWDSDAGLYYYRARWYDTKIGRFISEDPMRFAAKDANLSRYVGNNPINASDPTGLWTLSISTCIDCHIVFWHFSISVDLHVGRDPADGHYSVGAGFTAGKGNGLGVELGATAGIVWTGAPTVGQLNGWSTIAGMNTPMWGLAHGRVDQPGGGIGYPLFGFNAGPTIGASVYMMEGFSVIASHDF